MTLYILYNFFSPAFKAGGPIRSLANLVDIIKEDIPVNVICGNIDLDGKPLAVEPDKWIQRKDVRIYYSSSGFYNFKKKIRGEGKVFFINGIYSVQFNLLPALLLKGKKIVSARGMLHPGALSQKSKKKTLYLLMWKALYLHRKCEYHATSEKEKEYIQRIFGNRTRVSIASNVPHVMSYKGIPSKQQGELVLISIALISPMKNHLLILNALLYCKSSIQYHIYGPVKDKIYWEQCKAVIKNLPQNVLVYFHGEIDPEAVDEALIKSHVFIQPSESENFGHSMFEALTSGRPVITSSFTPWNDLQENKAGMNVPIKTSNEITGAIEFFAMMDYETLNAWSRSARDYALKGIDINGLKRRYVEMFSPID
jgi:glycosyltransferase involved in cell wall biosynthesis